MLYEKSLKKQIIKFFLLITITIIITVFIILDNYFLNQEKIWLNNMKIKQTNVVSALEKEKKYLLDKGSTFSSDLIVFYALKTNVLVGTIPNIITETSDSKDIRFKKITNKLQQITLLEDVKRKLSNQDFLEGLVDISIYDRHGKLFAEEKKYKFINNDDIIKQQLTAIRSFSNSWTEVNQGKLFTRAVVPVFTTKEMLNIVGYIILTKNIDYNLMDIISKETDEDVLLQVNDIIITSSMIKEQRITNTNYIKNINKSDIFIDNNEYLKYDVSFDNFKISFVKSTLLLQQKQNKERTSLLILFIIFSLVLLVVILIIIEIILFSFNKMIKIIESINDTQQINPELFGKNTSREIKKIINAVNVLLSKINQKETEIIKEKNSLEEKVKIRTIELREYQGFILEISRISNLIHNKHSVLDAIYEVVNSFKRLPFVVDSLYLSKEEYKIQNVIRNKLDNCNIPNSISFNISTQNNDYGYISLLTNKKLSTEDLILIDLSINSLTIFINNSEFDETNIKNENLKTMVALMQSIVHEIKTPLVSIKGYPQMILGKIKRNVDITSDYLRVKLELILDEAERIDELAKDLLEFTAMDEKNYTNNFTKINIKDVMQDVQLIELKNYIEFEHIEINNKITDDYYINGSSSQIKKIFRILIKNSNEAKKTDLKININIKQIQNLLCISFTDNGIGIPGESLKKVFDPLFSTKKQGTGLGLTVAKKIIEKHLGTVEIESVLDNGTTFNIYFPIFKDDM